MYVYIVEGGATAKTLELVHGPLEDRGPLNQLDLIGRTFGPRELLVATQCARYCRFSPTIPTGVINSLSVPLTPEILWIELWADGLKWPSPNHE